MTTVYVAAEKLMSWNPDGRMSIHKQLVSTLATHCQNNRFVVYFVPSRFGLFFENRREVEEAWQYLESALHAEGFVPNDFILFEDDVDEAPFVKDIAENVHHEMAVLFSESSEDDALSQKIGIRKVFEIPQFTSNVWKKLCWNRVVRAISAAAIHT